MDSRRVAAAVFLAALLGAADARSAPAVLSTRAESPDRIRIRLTESLPPLAPAAIRVSDARAPDVPIPVLRVEQPGAGRLVLTLDGTVNPSESYRVELREPPLAVDVRPSIFALMLSVFLASALINNFVLTRYLGLCIFFGVSKRRDTSIGMGITFTMVMVVTGMLSWALNTWVLRPLHLTFLQIIVFIGVVAFVVQLLDTVLRKTDPALHRRFGIYLMLITTNCIILAVPLLNAQSAAGPLQALSLAVGSGVGFALALFLMSCARERMELARVPKPFEGLPIAFALTGLFALAFMGFSGLDFFR
jgi:electron transport complex protein RnfA